MSTKEKKEVGENPILEDTFRRYNGQYMSDDEVKYVRKEMYKLLRLNDLYFKRGIRPLAQYIKEIYRGRKEV